MNHKTTPSKLQDPSFKYLKSCSHSAPSLNGQRSYIPHGREVFQRLTTKVFLIYLTLSIKKVEVFTEKNCEDIKSVSWLLHTSANESINALAVRYAPKEVYFSRYALSQS